jgi:hypothetical protein
VKVALTEPGRSSPPPAPFGLIVSSIAVGAIALLVWAFVLATLADLSGSDPAGNAYAQAYGVFAIVLLWMLLAILLVLAGLGGAMPWIAALVALIMLPVSGLATINAARLLEDPRSAPFYWPMAIPAAVPPLVIVFCFWTLLPRLRALLPAGHVAGIVWGATLVLSASIDPMLAARHEVRQSGLAAAAKWDADFAAAPADSPLWVWTAFLASHPIETKEAAALNRIRALNRRQSDAETMLDRGDFPLVYLGQFDLDPTPALCDKARALVSRRVAPLVPKIAGARPYGDVADEVSDALAAMRWLVDFGCSCDAQSQAWEDMARAYRDPNFDVVELRELRDPKALGKRLREDPPRFSMLTPQSHLKAWLKFAGDKTYGDQALAGARKLDRRAADEIDMLTDKDDIGGDGTALAFLPYLDLEPTPRLCAAAARLLDDRFAKIYVPKSDDPRSYDELLSRLGGADPLATLIWLGEHGCDVAAERAKAEALLRAYKPSPDSAAMLESLAKLKKNP